MKVLLPRTMQARQQTRIRKIDLMDMTVTSIVPYPGGRGRVAIYLNDEFAFVLYKGELSQYSITEGMTVDDSLYDSIMHETVFPRARKRGMNLLKSIDRTEADIRKKMSDGGYPPGAVDNAVEYLKSYGYINDDRYASEYIRCKSGSLSRRQIYARLADKGIDRATVENAFNAYDEENGTDPSGAEDELIRKLIARRCPYGTDDLGYEERQKLRAYLYGKGFSISDIDRCLT